jgi:hypothetical protein
LAETTDVEDLQVLGECCCCCCLPNLLCTTFLQGPGESGDIERLEMTREGFYQLVSLTSGEDFEAELVPETAAPKK